VYRAPSLDSEGFIHCSTVDQLVETANRFFANRTDLVVLCIDEARIGQRVAYEAPVPPPGTIDAEAEPDGESLLFPHVYGPIPVEAVVGVVDLVAEADGTFALPKSLTRARGASRRLPHK
jgi:uncharacterized protein (DUF952 family)